MSVERVICTPSMLPIIIRRELEAAQGSGALDMHELSGAIATGVAESIINQCTVPLAAMKAPIDPQIDLLNRKLAAAQACLEMQTEMVQQYANLYGALPKRA